MRFNRDERRGFGRFEGRRQPYDVPKPVKVGEEYDVEITEIGSKGDGITRIKNFIVFVDGAKKGEKLKIKITEVMGRFAIGTKVGESEGVEASVQPESEPETETETSEESFDEAEEVEEEVESEIPEEEVESGMPEEEDAESYEDTEELEE